MNIGSPRFYPVDRHLARLARQQSLIPADKAASSVHIVQHCPAIGRFLGAKATRLDFPRGCRHRRAGARLQAGRLDLRRTVEDDGQLIAGPPNRTAKALCR